MQVKCPDCGKVSFVTTDQYDPDKVPHGGMLSITPYRAIWGMDWLTNRSSGPSVMTCPVCEGMLVRGGKFVIVEASEIEPVKVEEVLVTEKLADPVRKNSKKKRPGARKLLLTCSRCGKGCKGEAGLASHMRFCKG